MIKNNEGAQKLGVKDEKRMAFWVSLKKHYLCHDFQEKIMNTSSP